MSRAKQRADRIRQDIDIVQVLADYGYKVNPGGGDREQQFSCDLHGDGSDSKPSARVYPSSNSWYCVSVHERVLTEQGWVKLRHLERLANLSVLDGEANWHNPTAYIPRGEREVVRVKTTAGYEVTVTPDHEIEVVGRGWQRADALRAGDVLVVPRPSHPQFNPVVDSLAAYGLAQINAQRFGNRPSLNLPLRWSQEVGEVLGYVFGDGWVVPRESPASGVVGLTSHADDVEDARVIFKHMRDWAGGRGSEVHRTDVSSVGGKEYVQNQFVFTVGNDGFVEFFLRLGLNKGAPAAQRRLPESLWVATECGIRGFLRGVYATDGSVYRPTGRSGVRVNLYSVSGAFLRDVQLLLLQFGIHSRLHAPSNTLSKVGKLEHPCWYLQLATGKDVLLFREHIGVANRRKQEVLDSYEYNPRGSRPFKPVVESVESAGVAEVADISMPVSPSFVANGIKVHNCFACGRPRDAIKTLETRYNLPQLPWEDEVEPPSQNTVSERVQEALRADFSYAEVKNRVERYLQIATDEREVAMMTLLSLWEAFDILTLDVENGIMTEDRGRVALVSLLHKAQELLTPGSS
jgi:intein/homing endonuclease